MVIYIAPKEFSQYLVLNEQVDIPDSTETAKEIQSRPPPQREQPENLQMRFKPYGFDTGRLQSKKKVIHRVN